MPGDERAHSRTGQTLSFRPSLCALRSQAAIWAPDISRNKQLDQWAHLSQQVPALLNVSRRRHRKPGFFNDKPAVDEPLCR